MSKKSLKVAAIVVMVCFVLVMTPMLNSAEKKPVKVNILSILRQPLMLIASMLHILAPVIDEGQVIENPKAITPEAIAARNAIKPTIDGVVTPPAGRD